MSPQRRKGREGEESKSQKNKGRLHRRGAEGAETILEETESECGFAAGFVHLGQEVPEELINVLTMADVMNLNSMVR